MSYFCALINDIDVLQIQYGIFLDPFTANLLLDHFIEQKQYAGTLPSVSFALIHFYNSY